MMMMSQRPIGSSVQVMVLLGVLLAISIRSSSAASIVQKLDRINDESSGEWNTIDDFRKAVLALKRVLANAKDPNADELMTPFRKRTCYFNAGMSHSCDYKELLKSVDEANYWSSEYTPGRRRKRTQATAAAAATAIDADAASSSNSNDAATAPVNNRRSSSSSATLLTAARRGELPSPSSSFY